jgi:hypothetical protein
MTESRAVYIIPLVLLAALLAFVLWKNWASVTGAVGGTDGAMPSAAAGGGGPTIGSQLKSFFVPTSIDPRKGSLGNPAGYLYEPTKNAVKGVASGVASAWHAVTPW